MVCTGVADIELTDYAVQVLGMEKDRKEFMIHLCSPQGPGRCEETGAALHTGNWTVVPEEADRGVERKEMTETGQGPQIAEAGPALFGSIVGEGLGAQVATLAGELGLDPPSRLMGGVSSSAPKSPRLGSKNGGCSPRGGDAEPSGGEMGVMSQIARHALPTAELRTPPG